MATVRVITPQEHPLKMMGYSGGDTSFSVHIDPAVVAGETISIGTPIGGSGMNSDGVVDPDTTDPYTFQVYANSVSTPPVGSRRITLRCKCSSVASNPRTSGNIVVKVTRTNGGSSTMTPSSNVPVRIRNRLPVVRAEKFKKLALIADVGAETLIKIPAVNLAEIDETVPATIQTPGGRWVVKNSVQKAKCVKMTLECKSVAGIDPDDFAKSLVSTRMAVTSATASTQGNCFLITLMSDENEQIDIAPIMGEYIDPNAP